MAMTKWKMPVWKEYILYESTYMTFWRRQNYGDSEKISGCQELVGREGGIGEAQGKFLGQSDYFLYYYDDE